MKWIEAFPVKELTTSDVFFTYITFGLDLRKNADTRELVAEMQRWALDGNIVNFFSFWANYLSRERRLIFIEWVIRKSKEIRFAQEIIDIFLSVRDYTQEEMHMLVRVKELSGKSNLRIGENIDKVPKDVLMFNVMLNLPFRDLMELCSTDKKRQKMCQNPDFKRAYIQRNNAIMKRNLASWIARGNLEKLKQWRDSYGQTDLEDVLLTFGYSDIKLAGLGRVFDGPAFRSTYFNANRRQMEEVFKFWLHRSINVEIEKWIDAMNPEDVLVFGIRFQDEFLVKLCMDRFAYEESFLGNVGKGQPDRIRRLLNLPSEEKRYKVSK